MGSSVEKERSSNTCRDILFPELNFEKSDDSLNTLDSEIEIKGPTRMASKPDTGPTEDKASTTKLQRDLHVDLKQSKMTRQRLQPVIDSVVLPVLPSLSPDRPENILNGVIELPSDIERQEMEKIKSDFQGLPELLQPIQAVTTLPVTMLLGGRSHTPPGSGGECHIRQHFRSSTSSSLQSSEYSNSSVETVLQLLNTSPPRTSASPGLPAEVDRTALQNRETTKRKLPEQDDESQEFQGLPPKIRRLNIDSDRVASDTFHVNGCVQRSSATDFGMVLALGVTVSPNGDFSQLLAQQRANQGSFPVSEQPALPPDEGCRMETKNKLGQKIQQKRAERGQGPLEIRDEPKPKDKLTPEEEQMRQKRKDRNKENARKNRENQKKLEEQLKNEVSELRRKNEKCSNDITQLSLQLVEYQRLLSSHCCKMIVASSPGVPGVPFLQQ